MARVKTAIVGLVFAAATWPLAAQDARFPVELSLYGGAFRWDRPVEETDAMAGFRLGIVAAGNFGLEGFCDGSGTAAGGGFGGKSGQTYGLDVLWNSNPGRRGGVYIVGGAG